MESNCYPGKIMCSQKTADLLISAGFEYWLSPRSDLVKIKGKGDVQCYWCNPNAAVTNNRSIERRQSLSHGLPKNSTHTGKSQEALVQWVTDMLKGLLIDVIATRLSNGQASCDTSMLVDEMVFSSPRDEVSETISIPQVTNDTTKNEATHTELSAALSLQLLEYISTIASWYQKNPFHNFEHGKWTCTLFNEIITWFS